MTKKSNIKEFEKLQKQCNDYLDGWKRALADYENFKKQSEKEKQEFVKFANTNLIMSLIPVYNNLKLALKHSPNNDWSKGVEHIQKQFKQVLSDYQVEEILPKVGDEFDINLHEAIKEIEKLRDKNNINKISKIISCGYKLNGKVFVPAKVIVK
ncbi:nucleotide exchange factor GrpE [Candidatus Parcubacteria bacterium]|nr:nucleotide exchange factor GrpE [Candidatus Parcubacteria bacterium]